MSDGAASGAGCNSDDFTTGRVTFLDLIDGEEIDRITQVSPRAKAHDGAFDVTYETHWPDSTVGWVRGRGRSTQNDDILEMVASR